jgi:hypothetical protein
MVYRVSDPSVDAIGFAGDVERLVDSEGVELVIPMTDLSAPVLLELRERRPDVRIPFPPLATYSQVSDKAQLTEIAAQLGVPVPRQVVISRPGAEAADVGDRVERSGLSWPLILKPARSTALVDGAMGKFSVRTVSGPSALATELASCPTEAHPVLLQERIVGPGLGVFMLGASEGRPLAAFAHRRIREKPPTGGVSVYRESIPVRDDLRAYSERIMERFRWNGAVMLEFKEERPILGLAPTGGRRRRRLSEAPGRVCTRQEYRAGAPIPDGFALALVLGRRRSPALDGPRAEEPSDPIPLAARPLGRTGQVPDSVATGGSL